MKARGWSECEKGSKEWDFHWADVRAYFHYLYHFLSTAESTESRLMVLSLQVHWVVEFFRDGGKVASLHIIRDIHKQLYFLLRSAHSLLLTRISSALKASGASTLEPLPEPLRTHQKGPPHEKRQKGQAAIRERRAQRGGKKIRFRANFVCFTDGIWPIS